MPATVHRRLSEIEWTSARTFALAGVEFALEDLGDPYDEPAYSMMKPRAYLDAYGEVLGQETPGNVVELGIRSGGSTIFFAMLLRPDKLVSIDICKRVEPLERFRASHPMGERIATFYRTSQDDESALTAILGQEMNGSLDLVIDDASHEYGATRASFEILFPRLRPGGWYVVEDWDWAHIPNFHLWRDRPALSNLLFQMMMLSPGNPELIAEMIVRPGLAFIRKGDAGPSDMRLDVESLCSMQGRAFSPL